MQLEAESSQVWYAKGPLITVDRKTIAMVIELAQQSLDAKARLCTHGGVQDGVHEMLIAHGREAYVRPHLHRNKAESCHLVSGSADLVLFSSTGAVTQVLPLGEAGSGRLFYYRLNEPSFHSLIVRTQWLIFHETISGPFRRQDTEYPDWAPAAGDEEAIKIFRAELNRTVEGLSKTS